MWTKRWLFAAACPCRDARHRAASSVRDRTGMFSADTVKKAEADLNRVERDNQITTTIETIETLDGDSISSAARQHAERSGTHGLFVLIAKKEGKIDVKSSSAYRRSMDNRAAGRYRERVHQGVQEARLRRRSARRREGGRLRGVCRESRTGQPPTGRRSWRRPGRPAR